MHPLDIAGREKQNPRFKVLPAEQIQPSLAPLSLLSHFEDI
jgi:hypothetical protein